MSGIAWLASYPKSGNTWVRALVDAVERRGMPDINALTGGLRGSPAMAALSAAASRVSDAESARISRGATALGVCPGPGWTRVKTHEAYMPGEDGIPRCRLPIPCRAVVVVRDPRDVCPSLAHHTGVSLEQAAEIMESDGVHAIEQNQTKAAYLSGSWSTHVSSWLEQDDIPALLVRYEDLTRQGEQELARILDFLEIPAATDTIARAVDACSFGNLVVAELTEGFTEAARPDAPFFRRGTVGTWREELSVELAERIEADHRAMMSTLGYL